MAPKDSIFSLGTLAGYGKPEPTAETYQDLPLDMGTEQRPPVQFSDLPVDLGSTVGPVNPSEMARYSPEGDNPYISAKKEAVTQASYNKVAAVNEAKEVNTRTFGSEADIARAAAAARGGFEEANDPFIQAALHLNKEKFGELYPHAVDQQNDFRDAVIEQTGYQSDRRTDAEARSDTGIDIATAMGNIALGIAAAPPAIADLASSTAKKALGMEPGGWSASPTVAKLGESFNEYMGDQKSDLYKRDAEIFEARRGLIKDENITKYEEDLEKNKDKGKLKGEFLPWLRHQKDEAVSTAVEAWDSPKMLGSTIAEGAGSIVGLGIPAGALGKAGAVTKMMQKTGLSKKALFKEMKSKPELRAEYKALSHTMKEKAVMPLMGATEAGSASKDAITTLHQQTETDMTGIPQYDAIIASGKSHQEALDILSPSVSGIAFATALGPALVAGRIAAKVIADPFALRMSKGKFGSAAYGFALNMGRETTEEFIQEGGSQFGENVGLIMGAGLEMNPFDDVAHSGTMGAIGGLGASGVMQAPSAAARTTAELIRAGGRGAAGAINTRNEAIRKNAEKDSAVGTEALGKINTEMAVTAGTIAETLSPPVVNTEGVESTAPKEPTTLTPIERVGEAVRSSVFVSEPEIKAYVESGHLPEIQVAMEQNPDIPLTRGHVMAFLGQRLVSEDTPAEAKPQYALSILSELNDMRKALTTDNATVFEGLEEGSDMHRAYSNLVHQLNVNESAPHIQLAQYTVTNMDPKAVRELLGLDITDYSTLSEDDQISKSMMMEDIQRLNPSALNSADLDKVMNQVSGMGKSSDFMKQMKQVRDLAKSFETSAEVKAEIDSQQSEQISKLTTEQAKKEGKAYQTSDSVQDQIQDTGNEFNEGKSLRQHYDLIQSDANAGRYVEARSNLEHLRNFAQNQVNKLAAMNTSVEGRKGEKIPYQAYNPKKAEFYDTAKTDRKGIYGNPGSPKSMAMMQDTWIDAKSTADLFNTLFEAHKNNLGPLDGTTLSEGSIEVPNLHPRARTQTVTKLMSDVSVKDELIKEATVKPEVSKKTPVKKDPKKEAKKVEPTKSKLTKVEARLEDAQEAADTLNSSRSDREFSRLDRARDIKVRRVFGNALKKFGLDPKALLKHALLQKGDYRGGYAGAAEGVVAFTRLIIDQSAKKHGKHVFMHEAAHYFDYMVGEGIDGQARSVMDGRLSSKKEGDLYQEIIALVKDNKAFKDFFQYALAQKNDDVKSKELFAELAAFALMNPKKAQELLPNGTQYIEDLRAGRTPTQVRDVPTGTGDQPGGRRDGRGGEQDSNDGREGQTGREESQETSEQSSEVTQDPEVTSEEVTEAKPHWTVTAKDKFWKAKGFTNHFLEAFKPKEDGSFMSRFENALEYVAENTHDLMGPENDLVRNPTDTEAAALGTMINTWFPLFKKNLTDSANKKLNENNGAWINSLESGKADVLAYKEGKALNFWTQQEDGSYDVNPIVAQAAFMSVMSWMVKNNSRTVPNYSAEQIQRRYGLPLDEKVDPKLYPLMRHGVDVQVAMNEIATGIQDFLGVSPNSDVSSDFTQGLFRSLAASSLDPYVKSGAVTVRSEKVTKKDLNDINDTGIITISTIRPTMSESGSQVLKNLNTLPDVFSRVFSADSSKTRHIGEAPKNILRNQLRNTRAKLSKAELTAVERRVKTPSTANTKQILLLNTLGDNLYAKLLGHKDVSNMKLNPMDKLSIEGKNQSIMSGIEGVRGYFGEMDAYAEAKGVTRADVPVFWEYVITSVGRLMQQGPVTQQANKTMREMITSTNSVIDLTDTAMEDRVWLAVAQAADIKIHYNDPSKTITEAKQLFQDDKGLGLAKDLVNEWLLGGMEADLLRTQKIMFYDAMQASGVEVTDKLLHAVQTVASMEKARLDGGEAFSKFPVSLSLEADGVTDGPINAMVHMSIGEFQEEDIKRLAKGGMTFAAEGTTFAQSYAHDKEDLYRESARRLEDKFKGKKWSNEGENLLQVMNMLLPGFGYDGSDVTIDREVTKNPFTVLLYGAGLRGIAGKLAHTMSTEFHKKLSDHANDPTSTAFTPEVQSQLEELFGMRKGDLNSYLADPSANTSVVTDLMHKNLVKVLTAEIMPDMEAALDETSGGLTENMKFTQNMASAQTVMFQARFRQEHEKLLNQRRKEGAIGKFQSLSMKDMKTAFDTAQDISPIYDTEMQSFHISAPESRAMSNNHIARSFDGKLGTSAMVPSPSSASVKVSPYMTIGTGDGRMILNIYVNADGSLDTSLPVYDGVDLDLSAIYTGSEQINKATYDGWMGSNIYESISKGYQQMLGNLTDSDLASLTKDEMSQLRRAFPELGKHGELTLENFRTQQTRAQDYANQSQARKRAMARAGVSVDHMAGAGAPHYHEGQILANGKFEDYAQIAKELNVFYKEELAKIEAEQGIKDKAPVVQEPNKGLTQLVEKHGITHPTYPGVKGMDGRNLLKYLTDAREIKIGMSKAQAHLFEKILSKDPVFQQSKYFFGSAQALNEMKAEAYPTWNQDPIEAGQTHHGRNTVFVANMAPETLLHEMLHTHTKRILDKHYDDPSSSPLHVSTAVNNLEILMSEFLELQPDNFRGTKDTGIQGTLKLAQSEIKGADTQANAIGEFLSWSLTNQSLLEATQDRKTYAPLIRIGRKILNAFKKFLGLNTKLDNTLLSNIQFNTELLISDAEKMSEADLAAYADEISNQVYGPRTKLRSITQRYRDKMADHLRDMRREEMKDPLHRPSNTSELRNKIYDMDKATKGAANHVAANGFPMNQEQMEAFEAIHVIMMSGMNMNTSAIADGNRMFKHVIQNLKPADLLEEGATTADSKAMKEATRRHELITGQLGLRKTADGRSDLLATFMALSQVDPILQKALEKMETPKLADIKRDSIDGWVHSMTDSMLNLITHYSVSRKKQSPTIKGNLDVLSEALSERQKEHQILKSMASWHSADKINDWGANVLETASTASVKRLNKIHKELGISKSPLHRVAQAGVTMAGFVAAMGSRKEAGFKGDAVTSFFNNLDGFDSTRAAIRDLRGQTESNLPLMRLINKVKYHIDALRQDSREKIPAEIALKFNRKLTKQEWSANFTAMGKADALSMGRADTLALFQDPTRAAALITAEEANLNTLGGVHAARYTQKAKTLAKYMMNKDVHSNNLQLNAVAIARLAGEESLPASSVSQDLINSIDKLTSLYAFQGLDQTTKDTMKILATTETEGMTALIAILDTTRELEKASLPAGPLGDAALLNGLKGYIPSLQQQGTRLIVAEDTEHMDLVHKGFTKVGTYHGSATEKFKGTRSYYITTVGGHNTFRQGVAQTVHTTYMGKDIRTGANRTGDTEGLIQGPKMKRIRDSRSNVNDNLAPGEHLIPIFDEHGKIKAYERAIDSDMLSRVPANTNLHEMIGAWTGRMMEEKVAQEYNKDLVKTLKEIYDNRTSVQETEYDNVADPKHPDPVVRDAWNALGWQIKADIAETFGEKNFFPVRKDMRDDAIGYRAASITDPWTGVTRLNDTSQHAMKSMMTTIMGKDAYKYLTVAEGFAQDLVSHAKTTIIVRSIVVIFDNLFSNQLHLGLQGIGVVAQVKGMTAKYIEVSNYNKNQDQITHLELKMAEAMGNPTLVKKLDAQIQALTDANKNMSIWPLIEAGEYSLVAEDLSDADLAMSNNKVSNYLSEQYDKLPKWMQSTGKNLAISQDTALFQGLNRMVQYGDFLAKAVLYDHLVQNRNQTHEDAMDTIMEEFVSYNRLAGRGRTYLESMGLLWFFNYKLRIMKVATNMLRERPLSALMWGGGVGLSLGVDSVITGSLAGKGVKGSLPYAFGTEMGRNAPSMHPLVAFNPFTM